MAITFQFNSVAKPSFFNAVKNKRWLKEITKNENKHLVALNYIFLSDEALLQLNIEYLNHHTYTDIITFDNSDTGTAKKIEGDVFISLDRVKENAQKFNTTFEHELIRVMAHGLLHLCGYKDKKKAEAAEMRQKEEDCLQLFFSAE